MKTEKSIEEVLQEEFLRERAAVLAKAAEKLTKTLRQLANIEESIIKESKAISGPAFQENDHSGPIGETPPRKRSTLIEINQHIDHFNKVRDTAKIEYYYLIVTREALGLRKHHWVEEFYAIPPKKKYMKDN
ncbi:MAG: hypothetical protein MUF26_05455 [Syntrophales bacterium]|nr:hypothetical protein [Syntrophales bacterium]